MRIDNEAEQLVAKQRRQLTHFTGIAGCEDNFLHRIPN